MSFQLTSTQSLASELKLLQRCLNWPVFKEVQITTELLVKIGELAHTAQIAGLLTCLSELTLLTDAVADQKSETLINTTNNLMEDLLASDESSSTLAKLCLAILDRFQVIVEQSNQSLVRNMNFKSAYILLQYLNLYMPVHTTYLQSQIAKREKPTVLNDANKPLKIDSYSDAKLTSGFDFFMAKLVALLKQTLLDTKQSKVQRVDVSADISAFDVNQTYTNSELTTMLDSSADSKLFRFVSDSLQLAYCKCRLIDCVRAELREGEGKASDGETQPDVAIVDSYKNAGKIKLMRFHLTNYYQIP